MCIVISKAGRGLAGSISQAQRGGPHAAYHWAVELIKKGVSATKHCSPCILNNPWVSNEVI